jgi:chromosome partitioning protein
MPCFVAGRRSGRGAMAKIITIHNQKGGVGKSTLAVNLACALVGRRCKVALLDADRQGTASAWALAGGLPVTVEAVGLETVEAVPTWLSRVLAVPADIVVIDTPPALDFVAAAALGVADLALVPVTASSADLLATGPALELVKRVRAERADSGPAVLLVPSKVDRRTTGGRRIEAVLSEFGERLGSAVPDRIAFVEALDAGQWVGDYAPGSPAAVAMADLADIVRKVLNGR